MINNLNFVKFRPKFDMIIPKGDFLFLCADCAGFFEELLDKSIISKRTNHFVIVSL